MKAKSEGKEVCTSYALCQLLTKSFADLIVDLLPFQEVYRTGVIVLCETKGSELVMRTGWKGRAVM